MVLIHKNGLWRVYATRWVGLGLWGRCVSYVRENCVSNARQQISYHMHSKTAYYMHAKHVRIIYTPKSIFSYQYKFLFLFGVLFIRIFMRPGSKLSFLSIFLSCQIKNIKYPKNIAELHIVSCIDLLSNQIWSRLVALRAQIVQILNLMWMCGRWRESRENENRQTD